MFECFSPMMNTMLPKMRRTLLGSWKRYYKIIKHTQFPNWISNEMQMYKLKYDNYYVLSCWPSSGRCNTLTTLIRWQTCEVYQQSIAMRDDVMSRCALFGVGNCEVMWWVRSETISTNTINTLCDGIMLSIKSDAAAMHKHIYVQIV